MLQRTPKNANFEYRKRLDAKPKRPRKGDISLWVRRVEEDLRVLRAARTARGSNEAIIARYLCDPAMIRRGSSTSIGQEVELKFGERVNLGITAIRACDVPWKIQQKYYLLKRNMKKRWKARADRLAAGGGTKRGRPKLDMTPEQRKAHEKNLRAARNKRYRDSVRR